MTDTCQVQQEAQTTIRLSEGVGELTVTPYTLPTVQTAGHLLAPRRIQSYTQKQAQQEGGHQKGVNFTPSVLSPVRREKESNPLRWGEDHMMTLLFLHWGVQHLMGGHGIRMLHLDHFLICQYVTSGNFYCCERSSCLPLY